MKKRLLPALLALAMVLTLLPMSVLGDEGSNETTSAAEKAASDLEVVETLDRDRKQLKEEVPEEQVFNEDEVVRVSIVLEKPSTLDAGYSTLNIAQNAEAMSYRDGLRQEQETMQAKIEREALNGGTLDVVWNLTLATNLISANVKRADIEAIKAVDGVKNVVISRKYSPDVISIGGDDPDMAVSSGMTDAQSAWDNGYTGGGTKIAIIDTGLDTDHQSFDEVAFNYSVSKHGVQSSALMDKDDIDAVFTKLNIAKDKGATPEALYRTSKVPYGWNYVDNGSDITHDNDSEGEHGSHVAGIAAANSYIPVRDAEGKLTGYENAIDAVGMQGNAPDAQLLIMKVFGKGGGAYDDDCVAAIEDAILLGADSVNLSLGMALPGFSYPPAEDDPYRELFETLNESDTVVVYSAGNAGAWADNSALGNLYSDGVSFSMGGESGSYSDSFTVASVDNDGMVSPTISVGGERFGYTDTSSSYGKPALATLDPDGNGTAIPYAIVSRGGYETTDFANIAKALRDDNKDPADYIAITFRGGSSFYEKGNAGADNGFKAVIVANNAEGTINMDLTDYTGDIPVVSITKAAGEILWNKGEAGDDEGSFNVGTLTLKGKFEALNYNSKNYTMSSFSSWGITGALEMKPEITAPGGNIWSVNGADTSGKGYELMSGTSMAAPQITGIAALVQQRVKALGSEQPLNDRALTMALIMSTAQPMKGANGNYYALMQQGAGLADANAAVTTPAYITVEGRDDGKAKAEVGDFPVAKLGTDAASYEVNFTVHNLTSEELGYAFSADVFTQDTGVYTEPDYGPFDMLLKETTSIDGATVEFYVDGEKLDNSAEANLDYDYNLDGLVNRVDAQILLNYVMEQNVAIPTGKVADVSGDNKVNTYDVHLLLERCKTYAIVPANGTLDVRAVISNVKLDAATYPAGGYVEAYIHGEALVSAEGVIVPSLNLPVLGFYGSWTDPSMYEVGTADEWWDAYADETYVVGDQLPYTTAFIFGGQGNDGLTNVMVQNGSSVITDGATLGLNPGELLYRYTPIRNSGNGMVQVTYKDEDGNDVLAWRSDDLGPEYGVCYYESNGSGFWLRPTLTGSLYYSLYNTVDINWTSAIENIPEGIDEATISVVKAPEYYAKYNYNWDALTDGNTENGELGAGAYLSTNVTIDRNPPEIVSADVVEDPETEDPTIKVTVKDDDIIYIVGLYSEDGNGELVYEFSPSVYRDAIDGIVDGEEGLVANMDLNEPNVEQEVIFDGFYNHSDDELLYQLFAGLNNYWAEKKGPLTEDVYLLVVEDLAGNVSTERVFLGLTESETAEGVTIYLDGVEVTAEDQPLEILVGSKLGLTALAEPINLTDRSVEWKSEDESIATVDENGVVTGVAKGDTKIIATAKYPDAEGNPVSEEVEIEVFTIPVTATGILGDAEGYAKTFTWDFDTGVLEYSQESESNTIYPAALTRYENNEIILVDQDGNAYELPEDAGLVPLREADGVYTLVPYDMTYSANSGYWWTYNGYLLNEEDPLDPQMYGFNFGSSNGTIFAIANTDEEFEYNYNGEVLTGDSVIYRLTNQGVVQVTLLHSNYQSALSLSLRLGIDVAYEGSEGNPFSNMVVGDDGALYISIMRNDTNEVYRLAFVNDDGSVMSVQQLLDSESVGYEFTPMGDFGEAVWPGLFTDVKSNTEAHIDSANTVRGVAKVVETASVEAASFSPEEIAAPAPTTAIGSLDTISATEIGSETSGNGIVVDAEAKTVTVPVYAESTNGRFQVGYDPAVLTLEHVTTDSAPVTGVNRAVSGSVDIGFASKDTYTGKVAELVFSYTDAETASITLKVVEDGKDVKEDVKTYTVDLSKSTTPPEPDKPNPPTPGGGGSIGGGGSYLPPVPSQPSQPSEPTEPSEPSEPTEPGTPSSNFTDVPAKTTDNSWYYDAVYELVEKGIIDGVGGNKFSPNDDIDRASIAQIIFKMAGSPDSDSSASFSDVPSTHWGINAINWASGAEYIRGNADGEFMPNEAITRQDLAVILWRYAQKNGYDVSADGFVMPDFADFSASADYAREALCWAVRVGIINGTGTGLNPTGHASRAEVVVMISRFLAAPKADTEA